MRLSKIISLLTVFIIFNVISLFLTIGEVSAAQIHCKLPGGKITEMYKSECKSKEGVVVDIEEVVAIGDKKKSKTSDLIKRLKSKTLWSMITGEESGKKEDKQKKSSWSIFNIFKNHKD